ncbi:Mur ligase [Piedraia hortae CBS 480.64]|uniref:Mur ligase n=1 Tax=Piedraia hortae CBS 480.64 TaxID=1314780 RepID=A0A6A7CAB3_9PEZI|nr:Mur ligase [Piedraia hortae CBS 480.64]
MPILSGLSRIRALLRHNPLPWGAIHVGGTNGKGSIVHYIAHMLDVYNTSPYLAASGHAPLKYGRFTSPHLVDRWDGITFNYGRVVPEGVFRGVEAEVLRQGEGSEFEVLTAVAFTIFTRAGVDLAVVEVGMGGKGDATNILGMEGRKPPLVTAISRVGLDHTAFLGETVEEIANEKAGIFKHCVPVVVDEGNEGAVMRVLRDRAEALGCRVAGLEVGKGRGASLLPREEFDGADEKCVLLPHQRRNLSVAFRATWTALHGLGRLGRKEGRERLADDMLYFAAYSTRFPGRLQREDVTTLMDLPPVRKKEKVRKYAVLLDGAHNIQSAEVLSSHVDGHLRGRDNSPVTWMLAFTDTKDVQGMLGKLLKQGDRLLAVEFGDVDGMPWVKPIDGERIVEIASEMGVEAVNFKTDILSAIRTACNGVQPVVVAGSLYLVGDVLRLKRVSETC